MDLLKACDSCMNNAYLPNTGPCYDCYGNSNWVKKPGDPNNYYWPELPEDLERWRIKEKEKKMRNTFVTPDDLKGFIAKTVLFGQKGKRICLHCDPVKKRIWYTLSLGSKNLYAGPNLNDAINLFNTTD